jgi:uncharacterized phage protein (TIGR02218 family)
MSRVWFDGPLETAAIFWQLRRRDGVALGFVTHDGDLWFDGLRHRAAPGMVPAAMRRSAGLEADSAEVQGVLTHAAITVEDLAAGRYDGAAVRIGVVDWETLERSVLYRGTIGTVNAEAGQFSAALASRKEELRADPVPRTSPTCRAEFCGPGCTLSAARFSAAARYSSLDPATGAVVISGLGNTAPYAGGELRWLDGPLAGRTDLILAASADRLTLDRSPDTAIPVGALVSLREGCDRRLDTCAARFANAINFRGEPFLPGNDQIARYASPAG